MQALRHLLSKLRRLDFTASDREITALKRQMKREVAELHAAGRDDEIHARNLRAMGIREGAKCELVGFGGKLFKQPPEHSRSGGPERA